MNIKTKLSLQFTFIVTGIILLFSVLTYYFFYTSQISKFREEILNTAKNTAILLINVVEVDSSLLKTIHQHTISSKNQEIAITDSAYNIIYSNNLHYLSDKVIIQDLIIKKDHFFSIAEKDGVRYTHHFNKKTNYVFVMAYDLARRETLSELRGILFWCILFIITLSIILSYFFSKKAIQPISQIVKSIKEINSSKLANRLNEGKKKDEIDLLAMTFNEMLTNLEIAFNNQKEFVSNASHELRTPLTVMAIETNYILNSERTKEEYINYISRISDDINSLNIMLNSLLDLAQINKDNSIQLSGIRIDELIYDCIHQIKSKYKDRKIITKIDYPENEKELQIEGNPGLLSIAIKNLIDNACKFSNDDVIIQILIEEAFIRVKISDKGIGIPSKELDSIFVQFKRASNAKYKSGFGIGLSLVERILNLHNAHITVNSIMNEGTTFEIFFKKLV